MGKAQRALMKRQKKLGQEKKSKEQLEYERKVTLERAETDIRCLEREKKFKESELQEGAIIEKNESTYLSMSTFPQDEIKPKFIVENELDIINQKIKEKKRQIEKIKQVEEEDAKNSKS